MKYAFFIGRWQPFHNGHDYIIRQALDAGKAVLIGVRDTPVSEADPFTMEERVEMLERHFAGQEVKVMPMPDIESVNIGRKVGYGVNRYDAPEHIEGVSATEIRKLRAAGDQSWEERVPPAIVEYIRESEAGK